MCNDNYFYLWIKFKSFFQCCRIHVPGIIFRINKYRDTTFVNHWVYCCIKCHIGAENFVVVKSTFSGLGRTLNARLQGVRLDMDTMIALLIVWFLLMDDDGAVDWEQFLLTAALLLFGL